jgi:signal transduction histidine kinase
MELASDLPPIIGDRVQLQKVVMNLMSNGLHAMKDVDGMGELAIGSQRADNEHLQLWVSDTGVGLPLQQADQILRLLYHQTGRNRPGTSDQPIHRGVARRPLVGCR